MSKQILVQPIISEKMDRLNEKENKYGFIVHNKSNKVEIKKAIEEMYGVSVAAVNTSIRPRKAKQRYTKGGVLKGKTALIKRAIITLDEGDIINIYENV